jgi:aminoacyl tRNA synthase complex-interacting multifunctional protein 1
MSSAFHDALAKLKSPVKELVTVVTDNGQNRIGETEADRKQVVTWIEKSSEIVGDADLQARHSLSLLPRT